MPSQYDQAAVGGYVATATRGGFQPIGGTDSSSGTASGFGQAGSGGSLDSSGEGAGEASFRAENSRSEPNGSAEEGQPGARNAGEAPQEAAGQGGESSSATAGPGGPLATGGAYGPNGASSAMAKRGANWAVPKAAAGATAYQIPVRVVCKFDRLTILPRPTENTPPVDVLAADPLAGSIDEFVAVMWKQIEQWDAAPVGGYWQPVLEIYVYPGAEGRFVELRSLLSGSGIQVQRQAQ